MGQEFVIKSQTLEDKVNQLLPSQGGAAAGVDLSASTTIVPIVDLTESAEGSNLRQDLQTALSLNSITAFDVNNGTSTIISNTGFFRVYGYISFTFSTLGQAFFSITDGISSKIIFKVLQSATTSNSQAIPFDFTVLLEAGDSLTATSSASICTLTGSTRQIATLSKDLVNP